MAATRPGFCSKPLFDGEAVLWLFGLACVPVLVSLLACLVASWRWQLGLARSMAALAVAVPLSCLVEYVAVSAAVDFQGAWVLSLLAAPAACVGVTSLLKRPRGSGLA